MLGAADRKPEQKKGTAVVKKRSMAEKLGGGRILQVSTTQQEKTKAERETVFGETTHPAGRPRKKRKDQRGEFWGWRKLITNNVERLEEP